MGDVLDQAMHSALSQQGESMHLTWSELGKLLMTDETLEARPVGLEGGRELQEVTRLHTDSRTLMAGDCFVALKGERFDANDYLEQVNSMGALGAIAHHGRLKQGMVGFEVSDTTKALGVIAAAWRAGLNAKLIAVTGSNGKTTVTQMIGGILHAWKFKDSLATKGNFNNAIGVPLTLLRLRDHIQVGVVELGMNHPGEIESLARWVSPDVALVNNAQREHQEFMKSVKAVAEENAQVFKALKPGGVAVFPGHDPQTEFWRGLAKGQRQITFGAQSECDVHLISHEWLSGAWHARVSVLGQAFNVRLHQAGLHNLMNALASIACAHALGAPLGVIQQGLEDFRPVAGRTQTKLVQMGQRVITLVDDSYNANPDSVLAGIETLRGLPAPRLLVLGDMGEVGESGDIFHQEVGRFAKASGIERLMCLGKLTEHTAMSYSGELAGVHFENIESLLERLPGVLQGVESVWVKGSRFMQMERVVQAITALSLQQEEKTCS
jgi:UDP-N-acetylmuramoyl-tripeptide--D-alanyl-D-alanine ligase